MVCVFVCGALSIVVLLIQSSHTWLVVEWIPNAEQINNHKEWDGLQGAGLRVVAGVDREVCMAVAKNLDGDAFEETVKEFNKNPTTSHIAFLFQENLVTCIRSD